MAEIKKINKEVKEYATDDLGMMEDAKEYAKRDFETTKAFYAEMEKVEVKDLDNDTCKKIAEALISSKFKMIKNARLNRVTYFD